MYCKKLIYKTVKNIDKSHTSLKGMLGQLPQTQTNSTPAS